MVGAVHIVMRLLLLSFIRPGVNGNDFLIFAERSYNITFLCGEAVVCFHVWHFSASEKSDYIAIVSNGEIQTSNLPDDDSKCNLPIKDLTAEDVGHHLCQQGPGVLSSHKTAPVLKLFPGKMVSLQCILFTYVEQGQCYTPLQQEISLTWVDETGAQIQEDSEHQIKQQSSCNIILTIIPQRPQKRKYRCQVTVGEQVQTSVELQVKSPGLKGRGRGFIMEAKPQDDGQDVTGAAVGVVGCVVLTALVAAFIVNRRRANSQPPDESLNMIATNNAVNADDVIYADVIFPEGSDRVWVQDYESTEYACVNTNSVRSKV